MPRERLANRRETETIITRHRHHDGVEQELILSIGRYPDGNIAEVFIEVPYQQQKYVTALLAKDVSTMLSIALQHGTSLAELHAAMGRSEINEMGRMVEKPHSLIGTVLEALMATNV